ncbi:MAG: T9SS type A sorting domain-containing protein, partial [bacterium]
SPVPKYQPPIEVAITAEPEGAVIRYSDDGSAPSTIYTEPLILNQTTTIRAQSFSSDGSYRTEVVEVSYTIIPPTGTAGSGPGGVGYKDLSRSGQPELSVWLKNESLASFDDGADILEWPDVSGNENNAYNTWEDDGENAIPETSESQKQPPVYQPDVLNGKGVAVMGAAEGEKSSLIIDDADNLDGGDGQSIFIVMKRNELLEDFAAIYQKRDTRGSDPSKQAYVFEMNGGADPNTIQYVIARDIFLRSEQTFNADDYYIMNAGLNGDLDLAYFNVDGLEERTTAYSQPIQSVAATVILGGFQAMSVAEVAYFNSTLNAAQTTIVHEYLSAKFGLALDGGNLFTNNGYTADLIGIGKANDLAEGTDVEHLHATGGTLELQSDGFAAAGDFVFAAHNGMDIAEDGNKVWTRMWNVQTAGEGGDVTMTFDFAKAGLTLEGAGEYILAYRASDTDEWTDLGLSATQEGDKLSFSLTDIQDGHYAVGKGLPGTDAVENLKENASFKVYPNPASDQITVALSNEVNGAVDISIYDLSGRVVKSEIVIKATRNYESVIDISGFDKGMYMIKVKQGDDQSVKPLVVK